ncbi:hypothetical protein BH24BAC1_BH24BAC1_17000 [soil metagenome]
MKPLFTLFDVKTCSRQECKDMLRHLRDLLLRGEEEKLRLTEQIKAFEKRLTQLRIINIKTMIKG